MRINQKGLLELTRPLLRRKEKYTILPFNVLMGKMSSIQVLLYRAKDTDSKLGCELVRILDIERKM